MLKICLIQTSSHPALRKLTILFSSQQEMISTFASPLDRNNRVSLVSSIAKLAWNYIQSEVQKEENQREYGILCQARDNLDINSLKPIYQTLIHLLIAYSNLARSGITDIQLNPPSQHNAKAFYHNYRIPEQVRPHKSFRNRGIIPKL